MTRRLAWLLDRATGDILVIMIASTICVGLAFTALGATIFAFVNPGVDLAGPSRYIADITNTLIGLLAGFLAGTSSVRNTRKNGTTSGTPTAGTGSPAGKPETTSSPESTSPPEQ